MEPFQHFLSAVFGIGFVLWGIYQWRKKTAYYKTMTEGYWVRKDENPVKYWLTVIITILGGLFFLAMGFGLYVPK